MLARLRCHAALGHLLQSLYHGSLLLQRLARGREQRQLQRSLGEDTLSYRLGIIGQIRTRVLQIDEHPELQHREDAGGFEQE